MVVKFGVQISFVNSNVHQDNKTHPVGKFYGNKNVPYVFYVEWVLRLTRLLIIHALFNAIHAYLKSN